MAETTLYSLESTISQRKAELEVPQNGKPSWTKRLLLDSNLLCSKVRYYYVAIIGASVLTGDRICFQLRNKNKYKKLSES